MSFKITVDGYENRLCLILSHEYNTIERLSTKKLTINFILNCLIVRFLRMSVNCRLFGFVSNIIVRLSKK